MQGRHRSRKAPVLATMALACLWPAASRAGDPRAPGFENEPTGFGGLAWRTHRETVEGLVKDRSIVGGECYTRPGDDRKAYGLVADKVSYCFVSGELQSVTLLFGEQAGKRRSRQAWKRLEQTRQRSYERLAPALRRRHGPPTSTHEAMDWARSLHWSGKASVVLNPFCCGVELILMDAERARSRFEAGADFGERAARALQRCWQEHRSWPATEKAFAAWMAREGKGVVSSWSFQEDGSVLIEPAGGALFMISARGLPARPPTEAAEKRQATRAAAEADAEAWARHADALFALVDETELVRSRRPGPKVECRSDCMRQLAELRPVPEQVGSWLRDCTRDCVKARQAAAGRACEDKIGKVETYLADRGEDMRRLAGRLPMFASQVSSRTHRLQRILSAMERRCPDQVEKLQALVKPVWFHPPQD